MQDPTFSVNSEEGQKHAASLLDVQLGTVSHVLMHFGTKLGHEGGAGYELGSLEVTALEGCVIVDANLV